MKRTVDPRAGTLKPTIAEESACSKPSPISRRFSERKDALRLQAERRIGHEEQWAGADEVDWVECVITSLGLFCEVEAGTAKEGHSQRWALEPSPLNRAHRRNRQRAPIH